MNKINKISRKIYLSFLNSKNIDLNKQYQYAIKTSNFMDIYFKNDMLINNFAKHKIYINPYQISEEAIDKEIEVNVIFFYADKINDDKYIRGVMHKQYAAGVAEYLKYNNRHYIVIYGSSDKELHCYDKQFFKTSFSHELIHLLDYYLYRDELNEEYSYGHPDEKSNKVLFPGMNGDDDDILDEKFAEYFTCKAERREYIYDLINLIEEYSKHYKIEEKEVVHDMIKSLNNKHDFIKLIDKFMDTNLNYASLALIYHLAFSKQKNGNKYDAMKILEDLL